MVDNIPDDSRNHHIHFIAGSVAGATCKLFEYPMDTIKVLQQTKYKGTSAISCLSATVRSSGVRGLYNGLLTPLLSCTLETALLFYAYEKSKSLLTSLSISPLWTTVISGMAAGACTTMITTPVEFIKCNLQVQSSQHPVYTGPVDCMVKTWREKGPSGMYRGFFATVMRESPGSSVWFVVYEAVTKFLTPPGQTKKDLPFWKLMVAGSASGIAFWTAFFPADVIKTQVQTSNDVKQTFWHTFAHIWRTRGVRGLYMGYWITVLRAVPANALLFVAYEATKRLIN